MKHLSIFIIITVALVACRKDLERAGAILPEGLIAQLKDSLQPDEFAAADFSNAVRFTTENDSSFIRVPVDVGKDRNVHSFLLLLMKGEGKLITGRSITIDIGDRPTKNSEAVNGTISVNWLSGASIFKSDIGSGYIEALHPVNRSKRNRATGLSLTAPVHPAPEYEELPEVVVIGIRSTYNDYSYGHWMNFASMFGNSGGSGYYGSVAPPSRGGDGGGSGSSFDVPPTDVPLIEIDFERDHLNPAIDVAQYLKCFSQIPDAGASCSIEIMADIPVDSDPNKLLNWQTGSPGHVFLQIGKTNGSRSITQNIGFYPKDGWKVTLTPAPVPGKFVDNAYHEFNASLKMALTPEQLRSVISEIIYLARFVRYDVDEYNCADFALDVFNKVRADKLVIPKYDVPGGLTADGTSTPQGIYNTLKERQRLGGPEATNIKIPGVKGWAGASQGPCN